MAKKSSEEIYPLTTINRWINNKGVIERTIDNYEVHFIKPTPLVGVIESEIMVFALALLKGDPIAIDAVKDILGK